MKENIMSESERMLAMTPEGMQATPDYQDDELMIVNNVKILGRPEAVKPNMNILAFCSQGRLTGQLNDEPFEVKAHQLFICPPDMRISNVMVSADFEYLALCITNHAMQGFIRHYVNVWNQVVYIKKLRVFDASESDSRFYDLGYQMLNLLMNEDLRPEDETYQRDVLKGLLSTLLVGLCHLLKQHVSIEEEPPQQNVSLFNRFLSLLQKEEQKHHTVEYYASQLFISSKYLTVICKKNSGKTANDWIREYTLADITYHLRSTELSIKEISNKLGFPNTSFFGKYVKEHFGCTPLEYRLRDKE